MERDEFEARVAPYRRELLTHCYRMLGSVHDAEDLVQETLLRAWRAIDRYDGTRASMRTWLYRIATNVCLTALKGRGRRALPSGLVGASDDAQAPIEPMTDVPWLQPFPTDPADALSTRGSLRLALVAAMQYLPARQRAVLVLRDVLDWPAAEVAEALETTTASVNSALQRARARLAEIDLQEEDVAEPAEIRTVVDDYVRAFEAADVQGLTRLLTERVVLEMPPAPLWFVGREAYGEFMERVYALRGTAWRMLPTVANGQPAAGAYVRGDDGRFQAHSLQVFTVDGTGISHNITFFDRDLFGYFGLPLHLE
ncbi:sigma-70 family RNA polymerase sigma factor [Kribbella hippodromi]|uniref:RNA polymerase sigma factor n=1 Tax=Kribbella hippodromi TaxID=434347 RepID=A0ABN2DN11_9ACTN